MALPDEAISLAALAARTVVTSAVTDAWRIARQGFASLFGRGDAERTEVAERRLETTREELAGLPTAEAEAEAVQSRLVAAWQTRLLDLLEENPEASAALSALVRQVQAQLPGRTVSAASHGLAVGGDVTITASEGAVAAGIVHGNVAPGNPTGPGPAKR